MAFKDEYKDTGGLNFVGKEEKAELIDSAEQFPIRQVFKGNSTEYGPKYNLIVELDGEERCISFGAGSVESRDRMLDAMIDYLDENEGEEVPVYLERQKQSILIRLVDDE